MLDASLYMQQLIAEMASVCFVLEIPENDENRFFEVSYFLYVQFLETVMVSSISGSATADLLSATLQQQSTAQNIDTAVLQKAQSNQKLQGEEAIKLIDSAGNQRAGSIDTYA